MTGATCRSRDQRNQDPGFTRWSLINYPSHVQGEFRCMPHPQTYRDCAALSRLKCTQSRVGISTYVKTPYPLFNTTR